jgi:hypothetical protein
MEAEAMVVDLSQPPASTTRKLSLASYALAAIAARLDANLLATDNSAEITYLQDLHRISADSQLNRRELLAALQQPHPGDRPLVLLGQQLGLSPLELLTVALALAVEEDVMVGRVLAYVQRPLGGSRPSLGLLATALGELTGEPYPMHQLISGVALGSGLLQRLNDTGPLPEQTLSLPTFLVLALRGFDAGYPGTAIGLGQGLTVPLPPSLQAAVQQQVRGLQGQRVLVLRTGCLPEGKAVAAALAEALACRPLFLTGEPPMGLGPWLLLRQLLPIICLDLAPGDRRQLPDIPGYDGPVVALCGPDGSLDAPSTTALSWSLPVPSEAERQQLWQFALGDQPEAGAIAQTLAQTHRHGSGRIAQLGQLTRHQQALMQHQVPSPRDVLAAARSGEGLGLDSLAQPLPEEVPDAALVVSAAVQADLNLLLLRCQTRDRLVEGLGASAQTRYHAGVKALFVGASGTGKTLAAGWLATKLGMPLYRVDLASITSKYIGETEKNLSQLLARAEQAEVLLLFDEADSLFGKRTDIKESNDRFANAQTNYLLQRIESYDGIVLLTSNSRNRFDAAFSRRLDAIVEFALPSPEERRSLWLTHLGDHHSLTPLELNQFAALVEFGGGNIRNVVLSAAVLARAAERPISVSDLVQGLAAEYRKLGQQMPLALCAST